MQTKARPGRDQIGTVHRKIAIDNGRETKCAPKGRQLRDKFGLRQNRPFLKTVLSSANVAVRS